MAQRPTDQERKKQLIATLAASRQALQMDRDRIKRQFNPVVRVRSAIHRHPIPAFATAAGVALLLTLLLRRRRREERPARSKRWLLGGLLALAKPAARVWIAHWAKDRLLPLTPPFPASTPANTP